VAPWEQGGEWDDRGLSGISRWLNRIWSLLLDRYDCREEVSSAAREEAERELARVVHQTIRKVTNDLEKIRFNTMIAALMEYTNYLAKVKEPGHVTDSAWQEAIDSLLLLLAPTAPHLTEELWQKTGHDYSIHNQSWPQWDEALAEEEEMTLPIQVNGKLRDRITVPVSISEDEVRQLQERERVKAHLKGAKSVRMIFTGKLVNFVPIIVDRKVDK